MLSCVVVHTLRLFNVLTAWCIDDSISAYTIPPVLCWASLILILWHRVPHNWHHSQSQSPAQLTNKHWHLDACEKQLSSSKWRAFSAEQLNFIVLSPHPCFAMWLHPGWRILQRSSSNRTQNNAKCCRWPITHTHAMICKHTPMHT